MLDRSLFDCGYLAKFITGGRARIPGEGGPREHPEGMSKYGPREAPSISQQDLRSQRRRQAGEKKDALILKFKLELAQTRHELDQLRKSYEVQSQELRWWCGWWPECSVDKSVDAADRSNCVESEIAVADVYCAGNAAWFPVDLAEQSAVVDRALDALRTGDLDPLEPRLGREGEFEFEGLGKIHAKFDGKGTDKLKSEFTGDAKADECVFDGPG